MGLNIESLWLNSPGKNVLCRDMNGWATLEILSFLFLLCVSFFLLTVTQLSWLKFGRIMQESSVSDGAESKHEAFWSLCSFWKLFCLIYSDFLLICFLLVATDTLLYHMIMLFSLFFSPHLSKINKWSKILLSIRVQNQCNPVLWNIPLSRKRTDYYTGRIVCDYVLQHELVHLISSFAHTPLQV